MEVSSKQGKSIHWKLIENDGRCHHLKRVQRVRHQEKASLRDIPTNTARVQPELLFWHFASPDGVKSRDTYTRRVTHVCGVIEKNHSQKWFTMCTKSYDRWNNANLAECTYRLDKSTRRYRCSAFKSTRTRIKSVNLTIKTSKRTCKSISLLETRAF